MSEITKAEHEEKIQEAIAEFAAAFPNDALSLITGLFVGILEFSVSENGGDETREIRIDGNGSRDITLHAKQEVSTQ